MKQYTQPQCKVIEVAMANFIASSDVNVYNTNVDTEYETDEQY